MERRHQPGEIIAQRYRIQSILGQGGIGITYAAEDLQTGQRVAVKAVSLQSADDPKIIELFERESRILAQLEHPNIPRYLDFFQEGKRRRRCFYLAQELASGQSLATLLEKGWKPDEAEVKRISAQLLEILVYLQQLAPPVIHRDIKPHNIIRRDDGQVFLVDFGAVRDVYHNTLTGGSTVAGTYGYMAPEQFRGQAVLATDLYALGATLIFLLTRKAPTELPRRKLKMNFRPYVRVNKQFANWLDRMIEPVTEDRFSSANEALAVLRGKKDFTKTATLKSSRPTDSSITLINSDNQLIAIVPPVWLRSDHSLIFALMPLVWNSILLIIIDGIVVSQIGRIAELYGLYIYLIASLKGLLLLGIFFLVGLWMLGTFLLSAGTRIRLEIDGKIFRLKRYFLGRCYQAIQRRTEEIDRVELKGIGLSMNKAPITVCTLKLKSRQYRFACFLPEPEKAWLVAQLKEFLSLKP